MTPERPRPLPLPMVHKPLEEWRAEHWRTCPVCQKDPDKRIS